MEEKHYDKERQFPRYEVENVYGSVSFVVLADVLNMSIDGAAIETSERLLFGKRYLIRFFDREKSLSINSVVVWCTLHRDTKNKEGEVIPVYKAGLIFPDIMNEDAQYLRGFIDSNRVDNIEQRFISRFSLHPDCSSAEIDCLHEFNVKMISLSGMLIELYAPLKGDSTLDMNVRFNGKNYKCRGEVVYSSEIVKDLDKKYHLGIKFVGTDSGERNQLSSLISSCMNDNK